MIAKTGPLVSIIITSYNYADYITDAIESALAQTYEDIEIIIINDGSTDNTSDILANYKDKYPNLKIIERENKGVIYTRNQGVKTAKGDFILQLDADDMLDTEYVAKCVKKAVKNSLDIVYTQVRIFGRDDFVSEYIDYDLEKLKHDNYMHATSLVRRSILSKEPYDTYLDKLGYEDWDMFLDLCLDGAKAGLVDEPLLNYRKHVDRKSRADNFEGLYKESLVRHHIWSKQNAKHPEELWYFSSQINNILETIHLCQDNARLKDDLEHSIHLDVNGALRRLRKIVAKFNGK